MSTLAFWQSMNWVRQPGVSILNTASILCYMNVNFMSFKMAWNMYFLNQLCLAWSNIQHLVESSIALFSQCLTLPNVCAFILFKLLIVLLGFPRLAVAFYRETAHERTQRNLNLMCHAWCVVYHCRPQNTRCIKGWLQFPSHWAIGGTITCHNSKYAATRKLTNPEQSLNMDLALRPYIDPWPCNLD
jgi:hypothetical protein